MKMNNKEVRHLKIEELRSLEDENNSKIIEGYALKFDSLSEVLGFGKNSFKEKISNKALDDTNLDDVRALIDHDTSLVVARTKAETMKLTIDEVGLHFKVTLPQTSYANDLYENIKLGNIDNCSFGFTIKKGSDSFKFDEKENLRIRTINKIDKLNEISFVSFPAYKDTDVQVANRSLTNLIEKEEQKEIIKRDLELLKLKIKLM